MASFFDNVRHLKMLINVDFDSNKLGNSGVEKLVKAMQKIPSDRNLILNCWDNNFWDEGEIKDYVDELAMNGKWWVRINI
jgi:hypothetical protein